MKASRHNKQLYYDAHELAKLYKNCHVNHIYACVREKKIIPTKIIKYKENRWDKVLFRRTAANKWLVKKGLAIKQTL